MIRFAATIGALVLLVLGAAGCAGSQKTAARTAPLPSGLETLEAEAATESVDAADLLAVGSWDATFARLDGEQTAEAVHACAPTRQFDATWVQTIGDERTQFLTENDAGDVLLTAAIDHDEHALTFFEPPMLLAPRTLAPGDSREVTCAMRVVDERNHARRRESGTCTRTIEYTERQQIRTPLGEFIAPRIDVRFHADLKFADVKQTERMWIVPGRGMVAQTRVEHLKILGMVSKTTERTVVRLSE